MNKMKCTTRIWVDEATGQKAISDSETGTRIVMVASTHDTDRDGQKINPDGWRWDEKNLPKLLFGHEYKSVRNVIGKLIRIWKEPGRLMIEAELGDKVPGAHEAALVAGYIRAGILDQGSVGFLPYKWLDPDGKTCTPDEPGRYHASSPGVDFQEQELLEYSIVPVPSLRQSALAAVRGLFGDDDEPTPRAGYRVVSDGTYHGTKIIDPDGKNIADALCITAVRWSADADKDDGFPSLELRLEGTAVEAAAQSVKITGTPEPEAEKDPRDWFAKMFGPREKAGRVLSRANQDKLANAKDSMAAAVEAIEEVLRSAERADQDTVTDDTAR